jgi:uncharacterized protein
VKKLAQPDLSLLSDLLACPTCHGELETTADLLTCTVCSRKYPIIDGIPVLIPQEPGPGDSN